MSRAGLRGAQLVGNDAVQAVEQGGVVAFELFQRLGGKAEDDAIADRFDGGAEGDAVHVIAQGQEVALMHLAFEAGGSILAHGAVVQDINEVAERLALTKQGASGFDAVGIRRRHQHFQGRAVQALETAGLGQNGHGRGAGGDGTCGFGFCCNEKVGHGLPPEVMSNRRCRRG